MKAIALTELRKMELVERPAPQIRRPSDVLLKLEATGVCGSDVHYYATGRIGSQVVKFPFVVGHECAARVIETGKDVTRVKEGDLVAIDPAMPCHTCDQCKLGRENTCRNMKFLGCPGQAEGCLTEYIVMPADTLFPVTGKITAEQAALVEPLSIGVYAVKQAKLPDSATIAILGTGPIGLSTMLAARAQGIKNICITDKIDERVRTAAQQGVSYAGNPTKSDVVNEILTKYPDGMDAVFECAGQQDTIDQAIDLLKPGGTLMLIGIPTSDRVSFIAERIRRKEITIINVRRQNNCVQPAIDLLISKKINADFMITHRFKLENTRQAFDLVDKYQDGVIKAMINF